MKHDQQPGWYQKHNTETALRAALNAKPADIRSAVETLLQAHISAQDGDVESIEPDLSIIREPERFYMTQISRVHWWRLERDGKAPKRLQLGPNSTGWLRHEIVEWIRQRAAKR